MCGLTTGCLDPGALGRVLVSYVFFVFRCFCLFVWLGILVFLAEETILCRQYLLSVSTKCQGMSWLVGAGSTAAISLPS